MILEESGLAFKTYLVHKYVSIIFQNYFCSLNLFSFPLMDDTYLVRDVRRNKTFLQVQSCCSLEIDEDEILLLTETKLQ